MERTTKDRKETEHYNVAEIAEKIAEVHLEQCILHKREQELIRQLVVARDNQSGKSFKPIKRAADHPKARATASSNYETIVEVLLVGTANRKKEAAVGERERLCGSRHRQEDLQKHTCCPSLEQTDRFGNKLKVGNKVEFLTDGLCCSKKWTIYKLTGTRVLCEMKNRQKTLREYQNVQKIFK